MLVAYFLGPSVLELLNYFLNFITVAYKGDVYKKTHVYLPGIRGIAYYSVLDSRGGRDMRIFAVNK